MKRVFMVFLLFTFLMIFSVAVAEMTTLKEYDENGNCVKEMYFENEQPFFYNDSYYGLGRVFEDNQCISITYLDADGNPMLNKSGYARVDRELDEENHVVQEMYYGVDGKPKALWGKHYGLRRWALCEYLPRLTGRPMVSGLPVLYVGGY